MSDGWQLLSRAGKLDPNWTRAENGNVALIGEIDFAQTKEVTLALGFGARPEEAALRVRASLNYGFASACRDYIAGRAVPSTMRSNSLPRGQTGRAISIGRASPSC